MRAQDIQAGLAFRRRRQVTGGHPPQSHENLRRLEPVTALTHNRYVIGAVDERAQALEIAPERHIDQQIRIIERAQVSGVGTFADQAPDETRCGVSQEIDPVQVVREPGGSGIIEWVDQTSDVDLGEVMRPGHQAKSTR